MVIYSGNDTDCSHSTWINIIITCTRLHDCGSGRGDPSVWRGRMRCYCSRNIVMMVLTSSLWLVRQTWGRVVSLVLVSSVVVHDLTVMRTGRRLDSLMFQMLLFPPQSLKYADHVSQSGSEKMVLLLQLMNGWLEIQDNLAIVLNDLCTVFASYSSAN